MIKENFKIMKDYSNLISIKDKNLILFIIFDILTEISSLLIPLVAATIIENLTNSLYNETFIMIGLLALLYLIHNIFLYGDYFYYASYFKKCYVNLHKRVINSIYNFDEEYNNKLTSGKIVNTCNMDLINIAELPSFLISNINNCIKLVIIIIVFIKQSMLIGIYVILINIVYCYFANICNTKNAFYFKKQRYYADKLTGLLSELLHGLKDVKSLNLSSKLNNKFKNYRASWEKSYFNKRKSYFLKQTVGSGIIQLGKILMYIFLTILMINNKITLTVFLLLISYYEKVKETASTIMNNNMSIKEEAISMYRISDIINYKSLSIRGFEDNDDIIGRLEFKNVCFKYKDNQTLNNVSFKAEPQEITTIVGHTGAGKTTLFNLLLRLYKPDKGEILIDNINIYNYKKEVHSSNVSIVNQKTFIFNMSIKDNLSLVDSNKDNQIKACKRVGIHKFIMSLPKGYNTILKEDATNISGGQKQLLSLARTLLTKAEIILLDEVTSSLDPKTTKQIIDLLKELKKDHTIIIITHNKDLMKKADKLVVLENGRVVGIANHKQLIKNNKYYIDLFNEKV